MRPPTLALHCLRRRRHGARHPLVWLLLAALLVPACRQGADEPTASDGERELDRGIYLILRRAPDAAELEPLARDEAVVTFDYRFLEVDQRPPREFMVVRGEPDVPLQLAAPPRRSEGTEGRPELGMALSPEATEALERLTRENLGAGVAIVVDGEVVTTHKIREVIRGGLVKISRCTDDACDYLLLRLSEGVD
jgi:hypothetical protein